MVGENLKVILECVIFYWMDMIVLEIKEGWWVVIVVYGNSLWVLVKFLEGIGDDEIMDLEILIGVLLVYELNDDLKLVNKYYLDK